MRCSAIDGVAGICMIQFDLHAQKEEGLIKPPCLSQFEAIQVSTSSISSGVCD